MNRRILVAAVTAIGVLVVGVGTASAATSTGPFMKKACPAYSAWDGSHKNGAWQRRHLPRHCMPSKPDVSIPTPVTKTPDVTIPRVPPVINCIKEPCNPTPDVTIEPWLQNPPGYCTTNNVASVDIEKIPQVACGCPPKTRLATDGGVSVEHRLCALPRPDVSILPAPPKTGPVATIATAPRSLL
jgi:hypothetical protein